MMRRTSLALLGLPALTVATLAAADHTTKPVTFHLTIKDVSTTETLKLSNGMTAPAPVSPGLYVVHTGTSPLFTPGTKDMGKGLEALAEDGDPSKLAESFKGSTDVVSMGVFNTPVGMDKPGPILPGQSFELSFTARPGEMLSLVQMFGQSNDLFYAPDTQGIALFTKGGQPITGAITSKLLLWDAGTEVNQEPGLGADQGPRQKAWDSGTVENGVVRRVSDSFIYPPTAKVIEVTLTPEHDSASK